MSKLFIALSYAAKGVRVFPCNPNTGTPIPSKGFHSGTSEAEKIIEWWEKHPDASIGGVCGEVFDVLDVDIKNGEEAYTSLGKLLSDGDLIGEKVTTRSGGFHYYFRPSGNPRRIKFLPSVDYLGRGGYTILPDQDRYRCEGELEDFIADLDCLPKITESLEKKIQGRVRPPQSKKVEKEAKPTPTKNSTFKELFFQEDVQRAIAGFMGVEVPDGNTKYGKSFRSIFPFHHDTNPSMASRWKTHERGMHLLIRDFSGHYHSNLSGDYNLVTLYATSRYDVCKTDIRPPEFTVWFLRLLHESGYMDFTPKHRLIGDFDTDETVLLEGMLLLKTLKQHYDETTEGIVFSKRFASAWTGLNSVIALRIKQHLVKEGVLIEKGYVGKGCFKTVIYDISNEFLEEQ